MDLGHLCETVAALCKTIDRPFYAGYSLNETAVERAIGLDSLTEAAIAHITIG
jgi:hypothetical protein